MACARNRDPTDFSRIMEGFLFHGIMKLNLTHLRDLHLQFYNISRGYSFNLLQLALNILLVIFINKLKYL